MGQDDIGSRLIEIESRNIRVEKDKAWETSSLRRISIAVLTYVTIVIYHLLVGAENAFIISLVPVLGFIVSTFSMKFIKTQFQNRNVS